MINTYEEEEVGNDRFASLSEWKNWIDELIEAYGEDSMLLTDAGHNNVEYIIRKYTKD